MSSSTKALNEACVTVFSFEKYINKTLGQASTDLF